MSFNFKKAKPFTEMPPVRVKKLSERSEPVRKETEEDDTGKKPTLRCVSCEKVVALKGEDNSDFQNVHAGRFSLSVANRLFGDDHDIHCVIDTYLGQLDESSNKSLSELESSMVKAKKLFQTVVPSSMAMISVPASQLYRCKLSRLNAMKRKLRFYIRSGLRLPSATRIASILFNDRENSSVVSAQILISEAIRRAILANFKVNVVSKET